MWGGRRITICREGLYYLCVALFIVGGAVLRERNLLVLLAGVLLGPLVIHWRLVGWMLRRFRVERRLPPRICAGDPLIVEVTASNDRRRLAAWAISVRDTVRRLDSPYADDRTDVEVVFPRVEAGQTRAASYRCHLTRRGRYQFGPLRATTRFPLGLIQGSLTTRNEATLIVCPRLGQLTRRWQQLFESERRGTQRQHRQSGASGGDYYGLREWQAGDSRRWIHWRTSAKLGELAVRQFEQLRGRDLALVVDLWQPDHPSDSQRERVELALSFAATVVTSAAQRAGSQLLTAIVGDQTWFWDSAPASRVLTQEILEQLSTVRAGQGEQLGESLARAIQRRRREMRVVVISTRPAQWQAAFSALSPPPPRASTPRSPAPHAAAPQAAAPHAPAPQPLDKPVGSLWVDVGGPELEKFFHLA